MIDADEAAAMLAEATRAEELGRSELVERLAVLGAFDAARLVDADAARLVDAEAAHAGAAEVVALLCEGLPSGETILCERERITALSRMFQRGGRAELVRVRALAPPPADSPLQRMLDAFVLGDGPPLDQRDEDDLLASLAVWRWATEAMAATDQPPVPVEPSRDEIESRLALLDVTRAVRRLAGSGCLGRDAELAALHDYCEGRPRSNDLNVEPAMVVYGIGGVGKSTLVARFVLDLYEQGDAASGLWAYLDLDRPTLASCDAGALLADIIRQVAAQRPTERRIFERREEVGRRRSMGSGLEGYDDVWSYRETASDFVKAMYRLGGGQLVVVLDTYEQLERNRPMQARELRSLFDLLAAQLPDFRLIVSGRVPASEFVERSRPDRQLHVAELDVDAAAELLRRFVELEAVNAHREVPPLGYDMAANVIELVGAIPLTVRIAARVLVEEGPGAIEDSAQRARTLERVRAGFVRGFLYRRILDHLTGRPPVTSAELRGVARASIVLRRVTADLLDRVLIPELPVHPAASAAELFDALAAEVAFMERHGGALRLREDLRAPALAALQIDDPALVRRVHGRAADFYARSSEPDADLERAYHRLALGAPAEEFDLSVLRQLESWADEQPSSSAAVIRGSAGDQDVLEAAQDLERRESTMLSMVDGALRAGRYDEARALLSESTMRRPGTELYRLESRLCEAEGDLDAATDAAAHDLDACTHAGDPTRYAAAAVRLAGLHEALHAAILADDALCAAGEANVLAGYPELRLELLLNRMNTRERTAIDDEASRWLHGLEARALMQRTDPRELAANTGLVRLLAAAFGREEPQRIREAVRLMGLGHDEDARLVQKLVRTLAAWDASRPAPGELARWANLPVAGDDLGSIRLAWSGLAGLGTQAGYLLEQVWQRTTPPEAVLEALRAIYLWWGVPGSPHSTANDARPHFLTEAPIDWLRPEMRELEEMMLTIYPTQYEIMALAARAGLPKTMSLTRSRLNVSRELLEAASRRGMLDALVGAILNDPGAAAIHAPLRALVGEAWLLEYGLN